jgi:hypothetical protein
MITAIGTAKSTPTNHMINDPTIILIKITTGLTPKVLFISRGIKTLFSNHWMRITIPITISNPGSPKCTNATMAAIDHHRIGPKYGMISVTAAINARDSICGKGIPKSPRIQNENNIAAPIKTHKKSCDLSQIQSFL